MLMTCQIIQVFFVL